MPKVNVYLPDDLAAAVRDAGIPVSTVCQRALDNALRQTTALREGTRSQGASLPGGIRLPLRSTAVSSRPSSSPSTRHGAMTTASSEPSTCSSGCSAKTGIWACES